MSLNGEDSDAVPGYPLAWPDGWRRTSAERRTRAPFGKKTAGQHGLLSKSRVSVSEGTSRVLYQLSLMGVARDDVVISTNMELRRDGYPRTDRRPPTDPGVAVYWQKRRGRRQCIAVDRYDTVADNLAAIAATLDAMRAIERHGGAEILERAFTGFVALPAPEQWFQVLGIPSTSTREEIELAHRRLAMIHHPDRGGDAHQMARINTARDVALEERHSSLRSDSQ